MAHGIRLALRLHALAPKVAGPKHRRRRLASLTPRGGRHIWRSFRLRDYGDGVPFFIQRFGPAYKAEVAHFAEQCRDHGPFCVDQNDRLRAMRVEAAGTESLRMAGDARAIA